MPYKDRERQNAWQAAWQKQCRLIWLQENGPCALCGSAEDLEVDHINPSTKVSHSIWSWSQVRRDLELKKCRALCKQCHKLKSLTERAKGENHGSAQLNIQQVTEIRERHLAGEKASLIILDYSIGRSAFYDIISGRSWR